MRRQVEARQVEARQVEARQVEARQVEASQAADATATQPAPRLLIYLFVKRLDLLYLSIDLPQSP